MNYKNHHPGTIALLIIFLSFFGFQVNANNYNQDIRHLLYTLPIIDDYGIAAELTIDEINRYEVDPKTGRISPMIWHEAMIRVPHWIHHTRYRNYYSEIPLFETLKAYGSTLNIKVKPSLYSPEDKITLHVTSDYSYKDFTTSRTSLPLLPEKQHPIVKQMMTILLGTNPVMLREFDTDSYLRWAWVDNAMGSWFEKQPIKTMPHPNPRVFKINPGDHYRMTIIMDDNNEPEAVLLDDAQGAARRKVYNYLSPLYYGANAFELTHHAKQSVLFGAGTFFENGLSAMDRLVNAFFFGHNFFEFAEHTGHLQVVQKTWKYFTENGTTNNSGDEQESEEEFKPDYILGTMDLGNLASTAGELIYQLPLGPMTLLENTFSLGIGIANLLVSANQKSLVEGYDDRMDRMITKYFEKNQRALYLKYKDML